MIALHLFVDLSACPAENLGVELESLAADTGLGAIVRNTTCILPAGNYFPEKLEGAASLHYALPEKALLACAQALDYAGQEGCALLVLLAPLRVTADAVGALLEALQFDPHFGFATPRVANACGRIRKLRNDVGDAEIKSIPRRVLSLLEKQYILPEHDANCFMVRRELTLNLRTLDQSFETLTGAWRHYMCRARRLGFRCVVVNHAVVDMLTASIPLAASVPAGDFWRLHHMYPETELARREVDRSPYHEFETFLARALYPLPQLRCTMLVDVQGMQPYFNGTAQAALGLLQGFAELKHGWNLTVLANPAAVKFHRLVDRFPTWDIVTDVQNRRFTAALRLSQPWDFKTIAQLHRVALFNFYTVLDTISWDILYTGVGTIEQTWRFIAEYSDGLLYNSQYTRRHFHSRFPSAKLIRDYTCQHSFHPDENAYAADPGAPKPRNPYFLVVGNDFDHKFVGETVDLLASAFPFSSVKSLGNFESSLGNVEPLKSGLLPDEEIELLYAHAQVIVFPSLYEGFGLPVLKGLGHDCTVITRTSELTDEIADRYRGPGRLLTFESPEELLEIVGRVVHGENVKEHALGGALSPDAQPLRWCDIARGLLDTVDIWTSDPSASRWLARQRTLESCAAYAKEDL